MWKCALCLNVCVYVCIQNSGSFKVKEKELVDTEKKKKSWPNGLWTKHIQTQKIYECRSLHISRLFKNTATCSDGDGASQFASVSVRRGKKKKVRLCDAFQRYQNILTTFNKSGVVQTSVLASIQLWKEEGSEKKKIKLSLSLDPRRLSSSHEPPWLLSPLDDPDRLDHESIKVLF